MSRIFEEIFTQNRKLTESLTRPAVAKPAVEGIKISASRIKVESTGAILEAYENASLDDIDAQFDKDPASEDEVVLVIDPELPADEDVPEDAAEQMIGSQVYKCPECGANYSCHCEDGIENESVDVDEEGVPIECPICGSDSDQILIGEIAPAEGAGEADTLDPVDVDDAEEETPEDDIVDDIEDEEGEIIEDSLKVGVCSDGDPVEIVVEDETDGVDEVVVAEDPVNEPAVAEEGELYFDENRFESLISEMINENYSHNNAQFKVESITLKANQTTAEIKYSLTEGKSKTRGTFVCEGFSKTKRRITLNTKDCGIFTESFTRNPAFVIECIRIKNKIVPISVNYNFVKRVNESLYRVKGSVGKKLK